MELLPCCSHGGLQLKHHCFPPSLPEKSIEACAALPAVVGLELKHKAPKAHTMLELVYTRWGKPAHIVFFFFAVLTNLLVSLSMLQGERASMKRCMCACCPAVSDGQGAQLKPVLSRTKVEPLLLSGRLRGGRQHPYGSQRLRCGIAHESEGILLCNRPANRVLLTAVTGLLVIPPVPDQGPDQDAFQGPVRVSLTPAMCVCAAMAFLIPIGVVFYGG